MVDAIISGGQTGADQGGIAAGVLLGLRTGGWAPRYWRTDIGPAPWLVHYGLKEHPEPGYPPRTGANVRDSDATLIVGYRFSPGCTLTTSLSRSYKRPLLCVNWPETPDGAEEAIRSFFASAKTVNVAGNRERSRPGIFLGTIQLLWRSLRPNEPYPPGYGP